MTISEGGKLHTLDAMRFIAAFAVAAYHATFLNSAIQSPYLAVDFFFGLSGFVIAYSYDTKLRSGMSAKAFIGRRLVRLYPVFALGLLLGLLVALTLIAIDVDQPGVGAILLQFVSSLVFLPNPSANPENFVVPLNGPYWSLILEIHINLIFAFVFAWLTVRVLSGLAAVCAVALIAVAWAAGSLDTGFRLSEYFDGAARIGFSFSVGILIWRLHKFVPTPRIHWSVVLLAVAALLTIPTPPDIRWLYDLICVSALFPFLILCGARTQPTNVRVVRTFALLGGASYALYAIHTPLIRLLDRLQEFYPALPYKGAMLLGLAFMCLAALATDMWYDRPVRRWLSRRFGTSARSVPQDSSPRQAAE